MERNVNHVTCFSELVRPPLAVNIPIGQFEIAIFSSGLYESKIEFHYDRSTVIR